MLSRASWQARKYKVRFQLRRLNEVHVTDFDASDYRTPGLELSRIIRLPELAWNSTDDGNIVLVGHLQHFFRAEASPCGTNLSSRAYVTSPKADMYYRKGPCWSYM